MQQGISKTLSIDELNTNTLFLILDIFMKLQKHLTVQYVKFPT